MRAVCARATPVLPQRGCNNPPGRPGGPKPAGPSPQNSHRGVDGRTAGWVESGGVVTRVLNLDISGRKLSLAQEEVSWLRAQADSAAGSSSAARDLASRIDSHRGANRLVLGRAEARTLAKLLAAAPHGSAGLKELDETLEDLLAIHPDRAEPLI